MILLHREKLKDVHPDLIKVIDAAVASLPFEVLVVEGRRTLERQKELYTKGRTTPGPKVTWSMNSRHITGHAADLCPMQGNAAAWGDLAKFDMLATAMFTAAQRLRIPIRWGADWDADGNFREKGETDSPHFELYRGVYP